MVRVSRSVSVRATGLWQVRGQALEWAEYQAAALARSLRVHNNAHEGDAIHGFEGLLPRQLVGDIDLREPAVVVLPELLVQRIRVERVAVEPAEAGVCERGGMAESEPHGAYQPQILPSGRVWRSESVSSAM